MLALIIIHVVITLLWLALLVTIIVELCNDEMDAFGGFTGILFSIIWIIVSVFIICDSVKGFRNKIINDYKNNKYIETVEYKYKTINGVKSAVDSTFTYELDK